MEKYIEEIKQMGYQIDYDGYREEYILTKEDSDIKISVDDFFNFFFANIDNYELSIDLISAELNYYSEGNKEYYCDYYSEISITEYEKGAELTSFNELLGFISKDECTIDNYAEIIQKHLTDNKVAVNNKKVQEAINMMIPLFKIVKGRRIEKEKEKEKAKAKTISKRRGTN